MTALETLKEYWGYESFRPSQEEIISAALQGRDVLAVLPTGGGKSICFQVPAMMKDGLALVITPLIALMKDQVQNLEARGIKALAVYAGMSRREVDLALNNAAYGDFKFLYISPERLSTRLFNSYLEVLDVNYIVVDEAHCISQWGYDFRPDYLKIGKLREKLSASVIALTATATPQVCEDIMLRLARPEQLKAEQAARPAERNGKSGQDWPEAAQNENSTPPKQSGCHGFTLLKSGFERENLNYIVRRADDKYAQMLSICRAVPGTGIIYMRNRRKCEEIAAFLQSIGESASFYHAGLDSLTRSARQADWKSGKTRIMVCTNAFGMGIDKPDVRLVLHMDLPESPEAYFQEAGRAGRDGLKSYAVLLWNSTDLQRLSQIERVSFPSLEFIEDVYQKLHIFFGITYENGMGRELRFDLEEFCRHFGLNRPQVHYAVKYLEREEHISFSEDVDIATRIKIEVERKALYDIELPSEKMAPVLETLMRNYPGIFSYSVPIDEERVAAACGMNVAMLRSELYRLSLEHLIRYIPCTRSDVIRLHHDRIRPGDLLLSPGKYATLQENFHTRLCAMRGYATEEDTCRSRYLLAYFGQSESADCGGCDVCRKRKTARRETAERLKMIIAGLGGQYTLSDLKSAFADQFGSDDWPDVLRTLIDSGEVPPYKGL
jgi:ATP-dependent DNA helicase RecQ